MTLKKSEPALSVVQGGQLDWLSPLPVDTVFLFRPLRKRGKDAYWHIDDCLVGMGGIVNKFEEYTQIIERRPEGNFLCIVDNIDFCSQMKLCKIVEQPIEVQDEQCDTDRPGDMECNAQPQV